MRKLIFNRSKLLKAIRFCCLLLAFSVTQAHAAPIAAIYSNDGSNPVTINNSATLSGYDYGIKVAGTGVTKITNSGSVYGYYIGVEVSNGASNITFTNTSTGVIGGQYEGVYIDAYVGDSNDLTGSASVSVTNSGSIQGYYSYAGLDAETYASSNGASTGNASVSIANTGRFLLTILATQTGMESMPKRKPMVAAMR